MTAIEDYGIAKDISTKELRARLKFAILNREQINGFIETVTEELTMRGSRIVR